MLIVGKNLDGLVRRYSICDVNLVDQFSLKMKIDRQVRRMKPAANTPAVVIYGHAMNSAELFCELEKCDQNIILPPQEKLLACSETVYTMPPGYFGLIQTKGTLARLFVSCTCNDGQVEPGYSGKITLEVINNSNYQVELPVGAEVAQIFIFQCSGDADGVYAGKYQGAKDPTLPVF